MDDRMKKLLLTGIAITALPLSVFAGGYYPGSYRANHTHTLKAKEKTVKTAISTKPKFAARAAKHEKAPVESKIAGKHVVIHLTPEQHKRFERALAKHKFLTTGFGSPVASIGAPNAFGGMGTSIFASAVYVNHWPQTKKQDGMMSLGVSLGNPYKYVGFSISTVLTSLGINNSPFASNGSVGFRVNRYIDKRTAVAFGMGTLVGWGASKGASNSFYAALTHAFYLGLPVSLNVGLGTGAYHGGNDVLAKKDDRVRPFLGMGVHVCKGLSLIVDYAAQQWNVGGTYVLSYIPKMPVYISMAGKNIGGFEGKAYFQATLGIAYVI